MVDYQLERGGMPLDDAVGVNCKMGATIGNQGTRAGVIWAKGCVFCDCVSIT